MKATAANPIPIRRGSESRSQRIFSVARLSTSRQNDTAEPSRRVSQTLIESKHNEEMKKALEQAKQLSEVAFTTLIKIYITELEKSKTIHNFEKAKNLARARLKLHPESISTMVFLVQIYSLMGKTKEATAYKTKILFHKGAPGTASVDLPPVLLAPLRPLHSNQPKEPQPLSTLSKTTSMATMAASSEMAFIPTSMIASQNVALGVTGAPLLLPGQANLPDRPEIAKPPSGLLFSPAQKGDQTMNLKHVLVQLNSLKEPSSYTGELSSTDSILPTRSRKEEAKPTGCWERCAIQ